MAPLSISLLGPFYTTVDSQVVNEYKSIKARALLAYLAVEANRPHSRETLAGLLWPDFPNRAALTYLRNVLSNLRKVIGDAQVEPPYLIVTRNTIQLNVASNLWIDLHYFEEITQRMEYDRILQIKNLEYAIALYRGPFLEGFSCDSPVFEEWGLRQRERFNLMLCEALNRLAKAYAQNGEHNLSIKTARRLLEIEPWNEAAHRIVMHGLAQSGQRSAALVEYENCQRLLMQDLGVEPSEDTKSLVQSIRMGEPSLIEDASEKTIKASVKVQSRLPAPLTSFVGRESELIEIMRLLGHSEENRSLPESRVRLLTLIGAGGCGKTRLAITVAHSLANAEYYPHGVWWVDLASISDPGLVLTTVAAALGLEDSRRKPLIQILLFFLREKKLLIVLDNAEHLIDPIAQLVEKILENNPDIQILVTSREILGIPGEKVWRVPSLSCPLPVAKPDLNVDFFRQFDAVRLFEERAHDIEQEWILEDHIQEVIEICARLDGIPLAIELAVARLRMMTVAQIAERLDNIFHLLTGGIRTALPRHQTLRACINWSYSLLSSAEMALLKHLSVFREGWSLEAVDYIFRVNPLLEIQPDEIVDLLAHLVDRSLVAVQQQGNNTRYRLLETIQQYAFEKLVEGGEVQAARSRHLAYFLDLAIQAESQLRGPDQARWHALVNVELANFRAAMSWALEENPITELRIASALYWFWRIGTGRINEGLNWLDRGLTIDLARSGSVSMDDPDRALIRGWALNVASWAQGNLLLHESSWTFYHSKMEYEHASEKRKSFSNEALDIFRWLGKAGRRGYALGLFYKNPLSLNEQRNEILEECYSIFQEEGDKFYTAECLFALGGEALNKRDYSQARTYYEQHLALRKEIGDLEGIGYAYLLLGRYEFILLHFSEAQKLLENALTIYKDLGYFKDYIWRTTQYLVEVAIAVGDRIGVSKYLDMMLSTGEETGEEWQNAYGLLLKGSSFIQHEPLMARTVLNEAAVIFKNTKDMIGMCCAIEKLALLSSQLGNLSKAMRLLSACSFWMIALKLGEVFDYIRLENSCNSLRFIIGEEAYVKGCAEGESMTLEQAFDYALAGRE